MVAKLYELPIKLPETDYKNYNYEKEREKEAQYLEDCRNWLKANGYNDKLTGKVISFGVGDGYAQYMVLREKPLSLAHLAFGDAYQVSGATIRGLTLADVKRMVAADKFWDDLADDNANFLNKQKPGTILHYDNGFNQFVRREVVKVDGKNKLKSIALVGEWRTHDLPHRDIRGEIYYPYHPKKIIEGELDDSLQTSTTYEAPNYDKKGKIDPRKLPAIDLTVPPMTADQENAARLWRLIGSIREALEENPKEIPMDNPENPKKRLERVRQLLEI